jgi:hypothetical protein
MVSRAISHRPGQPALKVTSATDEELAEALAVLPAHLGRQRNALEVLQAVRRQWASAPPHAVESA